MILPGLLNPALVQLQRDLQFRPEFVLQVSEKVAAVAAAVLIALVTESYWALVIGTIVGRVAKLIASYVIRPYVPRLSFSEARTIWGFSSWLSGSSVLTTLNLRIDQFIIGGVEGQSTLGQYVVGDDLAALPVREATTPLGLILYPAFSTMKSDHGELRRTYLRAMTTIYAVGLPIGLGFALVAEPVVLLLLGEKWAGAIIVIQVLSAFFGIRTLIMPADSIALTLGATRTLFNRTFVNFLIRMPLAIGGLLLAGIPGLLAGRFLTGIIMTAITADMVRRLIGLGFRKQLGSSIRSTVSGMTMSCVLVAWQWQVGWSVGDTARMWLELIAAAAVGAMLYVGTHLSLWLLAGRPPGAEQEIFSLVGKALRSKLGRGSAAG
jgi:O-antigen/teichoic acid export membrane protein